MQRCILLFFILCFSLFLSEYIYAHGANCDLIYNNIGVKAYYEEGTPFIFADVILYSPDDYKNPYAKGKTNDNGEFFFSPDKSGVWIVLIRDKHGHGIRKNIEVGADNNIVSKGNSSTSLLQKIVMAICVIFGLIGFSFFFVRRK